MPPGPTEMLATCSAQLRPAPPSAVRGADPTRPLCVRVLDSTGELGQDDDEFELAQSHRPRHGVALGLFTAMVTRIIPNASPEAKGEGCLKALLKETTKLRSRTVWDESLVEEWSTVRKSDPNATCGRVFSILGEKNAERHAPGR